MTSSEEEEADVLRLDERLVHILRAILQSLPPFTGQIVVLFCVLPVSISLAVFLLTAVFNFGIAFVAQTISSVVILLVLIPCLAVCLVSAIATAYLVQLARSIYLRLASSPRQPLTFPATSKLEIEEKLKTL